MHHGQHLSEKAPEQRALAYFLLCDLFIFIAAGLSLETTYKMLENKISEKARDSKAENMVERRVICYCLSSVTSLCMTAESLQERCLDGKWIN